MSPIVAANPGPKDSAHSGLYGVSKPRNFQTKFNHHGRVFVLTPPHISYWLSQSVWATRGWTYQEAVLSSRCLFFTPDQVYYADTSSYQAESFRHPLPDLPILSHQTLGPALFESDCRVLQGIFLLQCRHFLRSSFTGVYEKELNVSFGCTECLS